MSARWSRRMRAAATAIAILGALVIAGVATGAGGGAGGQATTGTAYIGKTPKPGNLIYTAGFNTDKVLGAGAVTYSIKALPGNASGTLSVKAQPVTLWTSKGSLVGTATALVTITNKPNSGDATVSKGKLTLTRGTGGLAGRSLTATFTGQGNISTGQYVFHYKGSVK